MAKTIPEKIDLADEVSKTPGNEKTGGKIKMMAEDGTTMPDREVLASPNTDTPVVPGNFHEFNGSQAKMYDTYTNRMDKIAGYLGNKVPVKG